MNNNIINIATVLGDYDGLAASLTSNEVNTSMVSGLTVTKSADKPLWIEGLLTYTITVDNATGLDFVAPTITDILDPTLVTLVEGSITVGELPIEETAYTYDELTGTLTITLDDIVAESNVVITFQVEKM